MLNARLSAGTILVLGLAAGTWLDAVLGPPFPCWLTICLVCMVGCCREFRQLLRRQGIRTSRAVSYGSVLAVILSNWADWLFPGLVSHRLIWPLATLCVANMVIVLREMAVYRSPGQAVVTASATSFLVFYLGLLGSFAAQLRFSARGMLAVVAHVAAAKCGDIGAYSLGRLCGRHKLCTRISPAKTIEGAVGGLLASVLATIVVVWVSWRWPGADGGPVLGWPAAALFGLTVGGLAQVGDLAESLIKRDCEQKDASRLVPGFGGVLDLLDSVLFSAPLAYAIWAWAGPAG